LKSTADFLESIVVPLWGVVAALLGTGGVIIGVVLTAWNSRKQQRIQFAQEAEQNRIARVMSLRRDVYMEASAAMARALSSLLHFASSDHDPQEAARQLERDFAAIGKVHVVASTETLEALMAFTHELGQAQSEIALARIPIAARERLLASGSASAEEFARRVAEQSRARIDFAELVVSWARRLAARVPPALVAIRRELELPLEENAYRDAFERAWTQTEQSMRALFDRTRAAGL
jgi:hypothetical protein